MEKENIIEENKKLKQDLKDTIKKNMVLYKNLVKLQNKIEKRDGKIEELLKKLKNKK
jgi:hypothetical protein